MQAPAMAETFLSGKVRAAEAGRMGKRIGSSLDAAQSWGRVGQAWPLVVHSASVLKPELRRAKLLML